MLSTLTQKILKGGQITRQEASALSQVPLNHLADAATQLRKHFCGNTFDLCTIINGKGGHCSENCKFCAQSTHYQTGAEVHPLLDTQTVYDTAKHCGDQGILRFSNVTAGRRLSSPEVEVVAAQYKAIHADLPIKLCASHGLLETEDFKKLKAAGVTRYHNNLETSRKFFPKVCSTHSYDDKIRTILEAKEAGLEVCSGGIFGLGETLEDRLDMAFTLRELQITSVPINILNPIPGTPLSEQPLCSEDDVLRSVCLYRFILPGAALRLAGGRGLLSDKGERLFATAANAAITGDMLTTDGIDVKSDQAMLARLGYVIGAL
ncbi:biotin synthase BioB [Eubacterium sp.]|uniref:biotin synthase BioB n=1 Tax=Eubacterium sp. TaxID=142586 RepID=UPI002FC9A00A